MDIFPFFFRLLIRLPLYTFTQFIIQLTFFTMRTIALLACIAACSASATVPELNVPQYLGRWFEMYCDLPTELFQSRYCVTADYGLNTNGTVSVLNKERKTSVTGETSSILGWAAQSNPQEPGQLTVSLQGPPFPAPYWVYSLGPATYNGTQYQYAIVSDPRKENLFVLARNVTEFERKYDSDVLAQLKELGFTSFVNKPKKVYHDGCVPW